jgi:hypothetical protein
MPITPIKPRRILTLFLSFGFGGVLLLVGWVVRGPSLDDDGEENEEAEELDTPSPAGFSQAG